jgi:MFS transporter, DHA2 family, multidrug resistance protein
MSERANYGGGPNPWLIAVTVMLGTFMEVLDTSVANVALPNIAGNLSAGSDESTWVLTSYLVSNAIVMPLSSWFSSIFGRKRFYLACVLLFTLSSLLCGLAPSLGALVLFRVLQGVGGGFLVPISQAVLVETFPARLQGMAMAVYGLGVMFAPVVGPTLGGWITDNYSWRWIFFINVPVGLIAIVLSYLLISDPPYLVRKGLRGVKIDYIGLGLLAVGLGFMQVILDTGQRKDWFGSSVIVWESVLVAVAMVAGVLWELRQKEPVVDLRLLQERNFAVSTFIMFLVGFVIYGSLVLFPFYLQTLMGYTAEKSGMALTPSGIALLLTMPIIGLLLTKYEARWIVLAGLAFDALALFFMTRFNLNADFHTVVRARVIQGVGEGLLIVPLNAAAFYFIAKEKTGAATGFMNLARNVGGSFGISIATTVVARRTQVHQNILVGHLTPLDYRFHELLQGTTQRLVGAGADITRATQQGYGLLYGVVQQQAAMLAFIDAFSLLALVILVLIPFVALMKKTKPHGGSLGLH